MAVFTTLLLAVVTLCTLIAGDPGSVVKINSAKVTNHPNDYFEPWTVDIVNGKRSSMLNAKVAVKKDVPETMQVKFCLVLNGLDPFETTKNLCDSLKEVLVQQALVTSGIPKGEFPKQCPVCPGDWAISEWNPPVEMIPPGVPDGPMSGYIHIFEEGQEPYIEFDFEGSLCIMLVGFTYNASMMTKAMTTFRGWWNKMSCPLVPDLVTLSCSVEKNMWHSAK